MINCLRKFKIYNYVLKHIDCGKIETPDYLFICPLELGKLRYLHKLFKAGSHIVDDEISSIFGFTPPADYFEFMKCINGATLYDNTFSIYGVCDNLNRGVRLEDQLPISLNDINNFKLSDRIGFMSIGSISGGNDLFEIEVNSLGDFIIRSPLGFSKTFAKFERVLCSISEILDLISNETGLHDDTGVQVDIRMNEFLAG